LLHRQLCEEKPEAGGILLGRIIKGSPDIVVDQAVGPSPGDRRGRYFFFRARRSAQIIINQAWNASRQTLNYLGEWHTHPEADPSPSAVDRRDWAQIAARSGFEQPSLLFVIVGRVYIRVWEVPKSSSKLISLSPI
jgi:integrative and conjugative element protein (TIGR02256 family)